MTTQTKDLNMIAGGVPSVVNVSQFDTGNTIEFTLYNNASLYEPPAGTSVRVEGRKLDGNGFSYNATLSGSKVTVTLTEQMTVISGSVMCELRLSKDSVDIGTANFILAVEESPINENTPISDTEIPAIVELARQEQYTAEAWAKGTRDGEPVSSDDPAYNNNAKYWASQSSEHIFTDSDDEAYVSRQGLGDQVDFTLEGASVAWNQLTDSANIGAKTLFRSTVSRSGNSATFTDARTTSSLTFGGATALKKNIPANHKVFMSITITNISVSDLNYISFVFRDINNNGVLGRTTTTTGVLQGIGMPSAEAIDASVFVQNNSAKTGTTDTITCEDMMVIDLTQLFGTTIADAIYAMEQAKSGSGVAFFKKYFPKAYYAYDSGSIQSVCVSARKVYDFDNNLVANYPIPTQRLRGLFTLANGKLKANGDVLKSDGSGTAKYGIVDLGSLNWTYDNPSMATPSSGITGLKTPTSNSVPVSAISPIAVAIKADDRTTATGVVMYYINNFFYIRNTGYTDATAFKTAMNGVYLVYELATPTSITTTPFQNPQRSYPDGTEEFVDGLTRDVIVPVGNNSTYTTSEVLASSEDYSDGIAKMLLSISAIGTDESNNDTASQAYSQGDYFYKNGIAKAKTSIASGATFTLGTNYEIKTLAEILQALES